jgi:hypothetical protein
MPISTSEVLNTAADLIERRGWSTGTGWTEMDDDGPLCIQGAIGAAMGQVNAVGFRCPAYDAVAEYLGLESGLFIWNDNLRFARSESGWPSWVGGSRESATEHGRTQVLATLRAAALIEAAKENSDTREQVSA